MGGLTSPMHLAFIAIIALIFLGPKKLPELARSVGHGMREFRDSLNDSSRSDGHEEVAATEDAPTISTAPQPGPAPAPSPASAPPGAPVSPPSTAPAASPPSNPSTASPPSNPPAASPPNPPAASPPPNAAA